MTRLIDVHALLASLHNYAFYDPEDRKVVKKAIRNAPTVNQWIPCSERLPSNVGLYLTTVKCYNINNKWEGDVTTLPYHYSHVSKWIGVEQTDVIAWMPLPKPYEEE